jgi:hypothetical protein
MPVAFTATLANSVGRKKSTLPKDNVNIFLFIRLEMAL